LIIIPSIDLRKGKCVRLIEGKLENEIIYSEDPVFMANFFKANGAKRIHIVDLDGAFSGRSENFEILKEIRDKVDIKLDFGGGVRDFNTLKMVIETGVDKVVLGTAAVFKSKMLVEALKVFGKERISVSVDEKDGYIHTSGWKEKTFIKTKDFIEELKEKGIKEIIFTEISRDGTLKGINFDRVKEFLNEISKELDVIIAGGVSSEKDIERAKELNVYGVIIGRAIYTGAIDLKEVIKKYEE